MFFCDVESPSTPMKWFLFYLKIKDNERSYIFTRLQTKYTYWIFYQLYYICMVWLNEQLRHEIYMKNSLKSNFIGGSAQGEEFTIMMDDHIKFFNSFVVEYWEKILDW